jgi:hypothetical protein
MVEHRRGEDIHRSDRRLAEGPAGRLGDGLLGAWHGPELTVADRDNSFTEVFTPRGALRATTSTADRGTATVTLRHGSAGDFAARCRILAARPAR